MGILEAGSVWTGQVLAQEGPQPVSSYGGPGLSSWGQAGSPALRSPVGEPPACLSSDAALPPGSPSCTYLQNGMRGAVGSSGAARGHRRSQEVTGVWMYIRSERLLVVLVVPRLIAGGWGFGLSARVLAGTPLFWMCTSYLVLCAWPRFGEVGTSSTPKLKTNSLQRNHVLQGHPDVCEGG